MRACGEEQCWAHASCAESWGAMRRWDEELCEEGVSAQAERGKDGLGVEDGLGNVEGLGMEVLEWGETAVGVVVVVLVGVSVCVGLTVGLIVLVLLEVEDGELDGVGVTVVVGVVLLEPMLRPLDVTDGVPVDVGGSVMVDMGVLDAVPVTLALLLLVIDGELLGDVDGEGELEGLGVGELSSTFWLGAHTTSTAAGQAPAVQFHTPYSAMFTQEFSPVHETLQGLGMERDVQNMLAFLQESLPEQCTEAPSSRATE